MLYAPTVTVCHGPSTWPSSAVDDSGVVVLSTHPYLSIYSWHVIVN